MPTANGCTICPYDPWKFPAVLRHYLYYRARVPNSHRNWQGGMGMEITDSEICAKCGLIVPELPNW